MVTSLDIGATAIAMAGGDPESSELHGKDIRPFMTQQSIEAPHEQLFWHTGKSPGITGVMRKGDFKLMLSRDKVQLYNLKQDMGETTNIAAAHPEKVRSMRARWIEWNQGNAPDLWQAPDKQAYQYADYDWLQGSQHFRKASK